MRSITKINRIKLPTTLDWPVAFSIDAEFISSFTELFKVHALAPKVGNDRDDIFKLALADNTIEAIFGDQHHTANVVLSEMVEADSQADKTNAYFSIGIFRTILRLVGKRESIGYLSNTGLRVDMQTKLAEYKFITAAKKVK